MRPLVLVAVSLFLSVTASGQNCPAPDERGPGEATAPSTLRGTLVLHDELRQWLGLKLERPICGHADIQLIFSGPKAGRTAESFRGCAITVTGTLFDSPTGYYSADIAMSDPVLKPDSSCRPFAVKPDPTTAPIPPELNRFGASIMVDYTGKGHVNVRVWESANKRTLQPWQAFVHYHLTGGQDVIWFGCREGFRISDLKQTPQSPNGFTQDQPDFPGTVLQDIKGANTVEFVCEKMRTSSAQPASRDGRTH